MAAVKTILDEREKGKFISFTDFVKRTYNRQVNKKIIEALILAGSFDSLGINRKSLLLNMDMVLNYAELASSEGLVKIDEPVIDILPEYTKEELIQYEMDSFGFYISNHPVSRYRDSKMINGLEISKYLGKYIYIPIEITRIKEVVTKKNDVMAFMDGVDEFTEIRVTLFPLVYKMNNNLKKYDIINIYGKVERRNDEYQIVANKITKLN